MLGEPAANPSRRSIQRVFYPAGPGYILQGHPPFTVWLYVGERAENHWGCERPSDLLNNPNEFLPVSDEDGRLILLQKDALMLIAVPAEYEAGASYPEEVEQAGLTITQGLELLLIDGTSLSGTVTYLRPDGRQRLQDFLNTADNFMAIRDNEMVQLVSRKCIASISPALEPSTYPRRDRHPTIDSLRSSHQSVVSRDSYVDS